MMPQHSTELRPTQLVQTLTPFEPRPHIAVPARHSFHLTYLRPKIIVDTVAKLYIPDDVMEYFRKSGAMGGKARAKKHSHEQLSEWAKLGGRPKGSGKKRKATKKGGK
jgi:hypothetical protein